MDESTVALLAVNDQFYRALSLADSNAMERLWSASDEAVCVHPGQPPLRGWAAIRDSWRTIFQNQGPLHVWPSEAQVRLFGLTADDDAGQGVGNGGQEFFFPGRTLVCLIYIEG